LDAANFFWTTIALAPSPVWPARPNSPEQGAFSVATAAENSQRWAFKAVATWLSANTPGDITSATHQSLRL
jgi:hypothetical protein